MPPEKQPRIGTQLEDAFKKANGKAEAESKETAFAIDRMVNEGNVGPEFVKAEAEEEAEIEKRVDERVARESKPQAEEVARPADTPKDIESGRKRLESEDFLHELEKNIEQDRQKGAKEAMAELEALYGKDVPHDVRSEFDSRRTTKAKQGFVKHVKREMQKKAADTLPIPSDLRAVYGENPPHFIENVVKTYTGFPKRVRGAYVEKQKEKKEAFDKEEAVKEEKHRHTPEKKAVKTKEKKVSKRRSRQSASSAEPAATEAAPLSPEGDAMPQKVDAVLGMHRTVGKGIDEAQKDEAKSAKSQPEAPQKGESADEGPKLKSEASPEGEYLAKYTALLKLLKSKYEKEIPKELQQRVSAAHMHYARELTKRKEKRDPAALAEAGNAIEAILAEVRLPAPAADAKPEDLPVSTAEALPVEEEKEETAALEKDATPAEARGKLRAAVTKFVSLVGKKEKTVPSSERDAKWQETVRMLAERSKQLDQEAAKSGKVEELFRLLGDKYSKLGWKSKVAIGAALGIGAGVSAATLSVPLAWTFLGGIGVQRVAGFASVFLSSEKRFKDKQWSEETKKWAALGTATGWTVVSSVGMAYLVKNVAELAESDWAKDKLHGIAEWMQHRLGSAGAPASTVSETASSYTGYEAQVRAVDNVIQSNMPSVDASKGHGYEWMAKRLWEQLQEKPVDASAYAEDSDIRALMNADEDSIDSVVHRLAMNHGASALIRPDAHMTIGLDGQLSFTGEIPSAPAAEAVAGVDYPNAEAEMPAAQAAAEQAAAEEMTPLNTEPEALTPEAPATEMSAEAPVVAMPEAPESTSGDMGAPSAEMPQSPESTTSDVAPPSAEATTTPTSEVRYTIGPDHSPIDPKVPAIYEAHDPSGKAYLAAYGGTDEERHNFIIQYLAKPENAGQRVRYSFEVPTLGGAITRVEDLGTAARERSWLSGLFGIQPKPPSPDTFLRRVTP
ncbi:MAG TPA: hypothetical protein VFP46_01755 [Candidatus Paceibacterota bacterium]|nr:hypothetical protein [Candidatus Paceibacterota bacterium]